MSEPTVDDRSWAELTAGLADAPASADELEARQLRIAAEYEQAPNPTVWLRRELQRGLGDDADLSSLLQSFLDPDDGVAFLASDDVVSTAVFFSDPDGGGVSGVFVDGLAHPGMLLTMAAQTCTPGSLVLVQQTLAAGVSHRRLLEFPFGFDDAVAATTPVSLRTAVAQKPAPPRVRLRRVVAVAVVAAWSVAAAAAGAALWSLFG